MKVSICCQTYNHKDFLSKAIDSFLSQKTSFEFEILIHDDASTDGTAEILKQYEKKHKNIRCVYQKENQFKKQNTLVNILFPMANGEYIALCEGDDYWVDSFKLEKQIKVLESESKYSASCHLTKVIDNKNNTELRVLGVGYDEMSTIDTISKTSLFHTSSLLFRKDMLILPKWFENIVSGDMAIYSILSAKGKIKCIPEVMSVYRKNEGGITMTKELQDQYHYKRIELIKHLNAFHDYKYDAKAKEVIKFHQNQINQAKSYTPSFLKKVLLKLGLNSNK